MSGAGREETGCAARRAGAILLVLSLTSGCKRCAGRSEEAPLTGVHATLDGAPLELHSANAFANGAHALTLSLSTEAASCERASTKVGREHGYSRGPEDVDVTLELGQVLQRDGGMPWWLRSTRFMPSRRGSNARAADRLQREMAARADGGFGTIELIQADASKPVVLRVKATVDSDISDDTITIDGEIRAAGCGPSPQPAILPSSPQAIVLEVAGRSFPVGGATIRPAGEHSAYPIVIRIEGVGESPFTPPFSVLVLSTGGPDCKDDFGRHTDEDVRLQLSLDGTPPRAQWAYLRGRLFPTVVGGGVPTSAFRVAIGGPLEDDAGGEVDVSVDGEADVDGFPTKVNGRVRAKRCPRLE